MAAIAHCAIAALLLHTATAHADPIDRWRPFIDAAAARFDIPARWIAAVMRAESSGRTTSGGRPITSAAGAMGLMQLMPGTWADLRRTLRLGDDPYAPRDNIAAGSAYLRQMYDRFGYPGLFAAYNVGPRHYAEALAQGAALPRETRLYLAAIGGADSVKRSNSGSEATLFVVRQDGVTSVSQVPCERLSAALFVVLSPDCRDEPSSERKPLSTPPAG